MFENHKKGEVGELEVAVDLLERGYEVFEPISQNCAADLVVQDPESKEFFSVQVKHVSRNENRITTSFRRSVISESGRDRKTNTDFDVAAVYCPELDQCFYVPEEEFEECLTLRIDSERNMSSIRWASDFEDFPNET